MGNVKTSVINLVLHLLLLELTNTAAQNCGVPSLINVKPKAYLKETLGKGESLVSIEARNVVAIAGVQKNPGGFAQVTLEQSQHSSFINLHVFKPLWDRNKNDEQQKSYIDTYRAENVEISINLTCLDGNHKVIEICVPIKDENTEKPRFSRPEYHLTTEPCFTGRCLMLFDTDIFVIDEDRDEKNALIQVEVDMHNIEIIADFDTVDPWYEEDSSSLVKYKKGFQKQIRLAYTPEKNQNWPTCRLNFTLTAWNQLEHVNERSYEVSVAVHVTFQEKPGRILPPVFSSSFYHAEAKRQYEWLMMKPEPIYATVPWNDDSIISYDVVEGRRDVLEIHENGTVRFIGDPDDIKFVRTIISFKNHALPFVIQASRRKVIDGEEHEAKTNASLTIFIYHDHEECDTTPWPPEICPPPICPVPEPCPSTTTKPPFTIPTRPPITIPTDRPITTTSLPTSGTSPTDETEDPTIPEETDMPPTTEQTENPSTEESLNPSTPLPTSTIPSDGTTQSDLTTTKNPPTTTTPTTTTTTLTTTRSPPWSTSTGFPEPSTTNAPSTPVGSSSMQPSPSTAIPSTPSVSSTISTVEPLPTTTPPSECACDCDNFTCRNPLTEASANFTYYGLYPDPFECTKFHFCFHEEGDDPPHIPRVCPSDHVFCPPNAKIEPCTTLEECLDITKRLVYPFSLKGYGYISSEEDDPCEGACTCEHGIPAGDPRNLCNHSNRELHIPDPEFCDIFHRCQPNGYGGYIDYPMRCKPGLIFCPFHKVCVPYGHYEECNDACPPNKTLRQCDTCIMGKWAGFDIFLKRFTHFIS